MKFPKLAAFLGITSGIEKGKDVVLTDESAATAEAQLIELQTAKTDLATLTATHATVAADLVTRTTELATANGTIATLTTERDTLKTANGTLTTANAELTEKLKKAPGASATKPLSDGSENKEADTNEFRVAADDIIDARIAKYGK